MEFGASELLVAVGSVLRASCMRVSRSGIGSWVFPIWTRALLAADIFHLSFTRVGHVVITGMPRLTGPVGCRSRIRSRLTSLRAAAWRLVSSPETSPNHPIDLGFGDSVVEVGDDLDQSRPGRRVEPQARAADAGVFMLAGRAVGRPQEPSPTLRLSRFLCTCQVDHA